MQYFSEEGTVVFAAGGSHYAIFACVYVMEKGTEPMLVKWLTVSHSLLLPPLCETDLYLGNCLK